MSYEPSTGDPATALGVVAVDVLLLLSLSLPGALKPSTLT